MTESRPVRLYRELSLQLLNVVVGLVGLLAWPRAAGDLMALRSLAIYGLLVVVAYCYLQGVFHSFDIARRLHDAAAGAQLDLEHRARVDPERAPYLHGEGELSLGSDRRFHRWNQSKE